MLYIRPVTKGITFLIFFVSLNLNGQSYNTTEVSFKNRDVKLSGSLILPNSEGPFPAIVFLHGSGPHERSGFLPYAEKFAELGFASLVFDKRGSGKSEGSWVTSSLEDLVEDAHSAFKFLETNSQIDSSRIGLWAISQSGWVAPILASRRKSIAFMIIISGGGASPKESELFTYRNSFIRAGISDSEISDATKTINQYFNYLENGQGRAQLLEKLEISKNKRWYDYARLDRILPSDKNRLNWRWVATYNPQNDISNIKCPVLLMMGELDQSHPTSLAIERWKSGLKLANNKKLTIRLFPNAGHGIRIKNHPNQNTRAPFAEGYLESMIKWLQENGL